METRFVNSNQKNAPGLPSSEEPWPRSQDLFVGVDSDQDDIGQEEVLAYSATKTWTWTGRTVYFFCDIHADADAFFLSLEASGGIIKTGRADTDFHLSEVGKNARFIIGGDCFDKGPNNLRLLEAIHQLYLTGADIELLAGNHDIRTYLGIYYAESKDPLLDHLFVRMGKKSVPLLKEIFDQCLTEIHERPLPLDDTAIKELLYPSKSWYEAFPMAAKKWMTKAKVEKELGRIHEKSAEFEARISELDLDLIKVHAAVQKFRELFFEPNGRYYWFFQKMKLAHREGSYLFVHAGTDDVVAEMLCEQGVDYINDQFSDTIRTDSFGLYYGVLGNVFRTKYRQLDFELSAAGVDHLHQAGIYAIVHGHRNILQGQRLVIRAGMLNFECDASVDSNTRQIERLDGPGGAAVVFTSDGKVKGISTDYPHIKIFHPGDITIVPLP
ncbi:MAG: hypothetical protein ACI82A_000614 [Candidatus Azotimanducaceae bacterium]|jgi:hypothetical protein